MQAGARGSAGVVGAGVIGLTTAILAQQAGFHVTVYAERPTGETTSAKAAASFKPAEIEYNELANRILFASWDEFASTARDFREAGVRKRLHWEASSSPIPAPWYLDVMEDPAPAERPEVPGGYPFAWSYRTFFIDTPIFLPWLVDRLHAADGELTQTRVFKSLDELAALQHDVVFNCTGLGARELCVDDAVAPVRGQIVVVGSQPEMDWSIKHDGFYVYPRRNDTVLGGTSEIGIWEETAENGAVETILRANQRILPRLKASDVRRVYAGLRPFRAGGIRIELEQRNGRPIVHNYGHGGAGVTLCWGSAREAVGLVI